MKSRSLRAVCLLVAALLGCVWLTESCIAQVKRYQPKSPTVSPYLNLTRTNTSAVPNYYSLVRPQQIQRAINQQEQALRQRQAGALQRLRNDVQVGLLPITPTGKSAQYGDAGRKYYFRDSTQFYGSRTAIHIGR